MAPDPTTVASLKVFFGAAEILEAWRLVFASLQSRAQEKVTITSKSQDGHSASGIALSGPEEKGRFIASCRQALYELDPDTYDDPSLDRDQVRSLDFRSRPVMM